MPELCLELSNLFLLLDKNHILFFLSIYSLFLFFHSFRNWETYFSATSLWCHQGGDRKHYKPVGCDTHTIECYKFVCSNGQCKRIMLLLNLTFIRNSKAYLKFDDHYCTSPSHPPSPIPPHPLLLSGISSIWLKTFGTTYGINQIAINKSSRIHANYRCHNDF